MDDRSFDRLARALGGASTRRGALAALAGIATGLGLAGKDADAKKKRRKCDLKCGAGQTCRQGACACDNGGAVCGASCCTGRDVCENGACVTPPRQCIPAGEWCKGVGRRCCDGRACASGQGGQADIGCYVPAGGACASTAECVFDSTCKDGTCVANPPPVPAPRCTVCASGCPHATIEAAIAAASAGDVITIAAGAYAPPATQIGTNNYFYYLTVEKALTLKACEPGGTVSIACPAVGGTTYCIYARSSADHLILEGLTLDTTVSDGKFAAAVTCITSQFCTITDCRFTNVDRGVVAGQGQVSINGLHIDSVRSESSRFGLGRPNTNAAITCSTPVTYTTAPVSPAVKCYSGGSTLSDFPGCGCQADD